MEIAEYLVDNDDTNDSTDMMPRVTMWRENPNAWTSFILGIISSLGWIIPIAGVPITIVGTVFGALSLKSKKDRGFGIAGLVINIIFLVVSIIHSIVLLVMFCKKKIN